MEKMTTDLINGNLTEARNQAKRYHLSRIVNHLHFMCGWGVDRSNKAAKYLKTGEGFQEYCDAK